jgi:hypothetical protein
MDLDELERAEMKRRRLNSPEGREEEELEELFFHFGVWYLTGINHKEKNLSKAIHFFQQSIQLCPELPDARYYLSVLTEKDGNFLACNFQDNRARFALQEPRDRSADRIECAYALAAEAAEAFKLGRLLEQKWLLKQAKTFSPVPPPVWYGEGKQLLAEGGSPSEAFLLIKRAADQLWTAAEGEIAKMCYHGMVQGDLEQIIYYSSRCLGHGGNSPEFYLVLLKVLDQFLHSKSIVLLPLVYLLGEAVYFRVYDCSFWRRSGGLRQDQKEVHLLAMRIFMRWESKVRRNIYMCLWGFRTLGMPRDVIKMIVVDVFSSRYDPCWYGEEEVQSQKTTKKHKK